MSRINDVIKITTLCENRTFRAGLLGEHGLAMLLEVRGRTILFDTGAGATLKSNAKNLGLDFDRIDAVLLSHGHYDHTGGLETVLKMRNRSTLPVYAHPNIFDQKYVLLEGEEPRYIGLPRQRAELESLGARFRLNRESQLLGEGIRTTGEITRKVQAKQPGPSFLIKTGDRLIEDPFRDDLALIIESGAGLIVLLGCAHAGLIDTLDHVLAMTGQRKIYAVLGGTHLLNISDQLLDLTISNLDRFKLEIIAPCHCTGIRANCVLQRAFEEKWLEHQAGSVFQFPL